jgi:hypothetical protein
LAVPNLFAEGAEPPRAPYPDDFTPHPCAPANSCVSFAESELSSAAFRFLGLNLSGHWIQDHYAEMQQAMAPVCRKQATCLATPGNTVSFCNDLIAPMMRNVCDTAFSKDKQPRDYETCRGFMETYVLGVDQRSRKVAVEAQKCAGPQTPKTKPPIVWMVPSQIPLDYKGDVTFYALDPDTHVPVQAEIGFEGQIHHSAANPTGKSSSYYPFKLPFTFIEVPNAAGHRDLAPPLVTVTAAGYPPVEFRLDTPIPKVIVEMKPSAAKLKRRQKVVVSAHDGATGKPVELRVFVGELQAGDTNQRIVIDWPKKSKRPEIWAKSLFNRYGDVVIVPAEK